MSEVVDQRKIIEDKAREIVPLIEGLNIYQVEEVCKSVLDWAKWMPVKVALPPTKQQ